MSILQELETAEAQYDEHVKRILSNRYILAWILKSTMEEFGEISIRRIAEECIGEDVVVSRMHVLPGQSNTGGENEEKGLIVSEENRESICEENEESDLARNKVPDRILGSNIEDKVPGEGAIFYDIRFSAYTLGKAEIKKILMNIEAQKTFHMKYPLITRGIFYGIRMISAQLDTEFTADNYSDMKKVYSIWICMNAPDYIGNAISEYGIKKTDLLEGIPDKKEEYDKMSIIMICLNGTKEGRDKGEGLVRLLNTLFAKDMSAEEKGKILSEDYGIEIDDDFGEEMSHMCNLGEGIREEALEEGMERGRTQGENRKLIEQVCRKLKKEKTPDIIAEELEEDLEKIQSICETASAFAPDYDCDEVYKAWEEKTNYLKNNTNEK